MQVRFAMALGLGLAMATGLAGCGSDEKDASETAAQVERRPIPVQALRSVEIGRTRTGFSVTAYGTAPGTGFSAPRLVARRNGQPGPDGFLDFDFVALPPDPALNMPQGTVTARAIRADAQLMARALRGVLGLRVHTITNSGQLAFDSAAGGSTAPARAAGG